MRVRANLLKYIGPGFISAVAGLEITNIGSFSYVGSVYGFKILWAIAFAIIVTAFFQQLAVEVGIYNGRGIIIESRLTLGKHFTLFMLITLYISNLLTAVLNIAGAGMAIETLTGMPWYITSSAFLILIYGFIVKKNHKRVERILSLLSIALVVYIILALEYVINRPDTIIDILKGTFIPYFKLDKEFILDFLMILGAAAAPYSIIFNVSSVLNKTLFTLPEEMKDIIVGLVFTSLASISIALVSAYPSLRAGTIHEIVLTLQSSKPVHAILFIVGSIASALLSTLAIIICNVYVLYEYRGYRIIWEDIIYTRRYRSQVTLSVIIILCIMLGLGLLYNLSANVYMILLRMASVSTSFASWIPCVIIVVAYWSIREFRSSFIRVISALLAGFLAIANIIGFMSVVGLSLLQH